MNPGRAGFTLVELLVAMLVALFLAVGLVTILQNNRATYSNQNALAQLQDNQRLAMTMLNDVVQEAGYYPDPTTNTVTGLMAPMSLGAGTPVTGNLQSLQTVSGVYQSADPGDSVAVRYITTSGDGILLCDGTSNTSGAVTSYVNTFSVNASGQLVCQISVGNAAASTARTLVSGIKRLNIMYGVKRDFTSSNNNVDTYVRADQMATADWLNVSTVKIAIVFINPMATNAKGVAVPGQPATFTFQRIIAVMSRTGITS
jgi:type IV pilus assembly protein PilW